MQQGRFKDAVQWLAEQAVREALRALGGWLWRQLKQTLTEP